MNSLDAFARLRDAWRDVLDLLSGRLDADWWRQTQRNRYALYCCRAAQDFEAAGDDRSAADCRGMAMGAQQ